MSAPRSLTLSFTPYRDSDCTYYVLKEVFEESLRNYYSTSSLDDQKSYDLGIPLKFGKSRRTYRARLHAVRCFQGKYYSVTLRDLKPAVGPRLKVESRWRERFSKASVLTDSIIGWQPDKCLAPVDALGGILFEQIFQAGANSSQPFMANGLVLFSGATGSAKTTYMNSIFNMYIKARRQLNRKRDHVVVIGDPIETLCYGKTLSEIAEYQCRSQRDRPLDYTPREIGKNKDVESIREATRDALRETPSVLVIGELRDRAEFAAALEFAGTGHLVLATSHSTSLVDAMDKLLRYTRTTTAAGRATVATQLKAIIHHRFLTTAEPYTFSPLLEKDGACFEGRRTTKPVRLNVPSVWIGNSEGQRNLIAEGLSSLVNTAPEANHYSGVLGRYWMATKLTGDTYIARGLRSGSGENARSLAGKMKPRIQELARQARAELCRTALKLDLTNE